MALYRIGEDVPRVAASAWIADSAEVVGKVELGEDVGIWFGAVLRADTDPIRIGNGSNVQDGAVMHADPGFPATLGEHVTVGHQAMLHGYQVGGTSPFGTRRAMPVYLQATVATLPRIYVNGGRRGYLVGLDPADLVRVLKPVLVGIAAHPKAE